MTYHLNIIEFASPEYVETIELRQLVLRKPLGLEFATQQLSEEYKDIHLALYSSSQDLMACMILSPIDATCIKMRQVAVHPDHQRMGIGRALVEYSEKLSAFKGFSKIVLHARATAVDFYKSLNYNQEGDVFEEVGIPHFNMWKNLKN